MWLEIVAWVSILLGVFTALLIILDERKNPNAMSIMNIVWPITGLYFPIIGLYFYSLMGRSNVNKETGGNHPFWKDIFVSSTHCGSGCVIGDIIGAPIVFISGLTLLGHPLFAEFALELTLAYLFGIAFQFIPIDAMQQMMKQPLSKGEIIVKAIKADTLSLTAYELGMFGWMAFVHFIVIPINTPTPNTITYWFLMQIGMIMGFLTTYPANWFLINCGIKGKMCT